MTHSLRVTMVDVGAAAAREVAAMLARFVDLIARAGWAGGRATGDPADDGVDTAGEAISSINQVQLVA